MDAQPIYLKIVNDIRQRIEQGILKADDAVPSEASICDEYSVSRLTARKALEMLENERLIYFVPGKGNFVRKHDDIRFVFTFNEMDFDLCSVDRISIVNVDVIESTKELVYRLQIHPNMRVLRIIRLLISSETAVGYDLKYIPYYPGFPLVESELEAKDFVEMLSSRTSVYSVKNEMEIIAMNAPEDVAQYLGLTGGDAVLAVSQLLSDEETGILASSMTYYNARYVKLRMEWRK